MSEPIYTHSLKDYRDYHNTVDSVVNKKTKETIIRTLKGGKLSIEDIAQYNGVLIELVLQIQEEMKKI